MFRYGSTPCHMSYMWPVPKLNKPGTRSLTSQFLSKISSTRIRLTLEVAKDHAFHSPKEINNYIYTTQEGKQLLELAKYSDDPGANSIHRSDLKWIWWKLMSWRQSSEWRRAGRFILGFLKSHHSNRISPCYLLRAKRERTFICTHGYRAKHWHQTANNFPFWIAFFPP